MKVEDRVRQFLLEEVGWQGDPSTLTSDVPLLDSGILDSIGIFQLVAALEEEYDVQIQDRDLVPENFGSIKGIVRLVHARGGRSE